MMSPNRCAWAESSEDYREYHDLEWGLPVRDDAGLFERLSLEGFQAGLSWLTILRKREAFRAAFAGFDPEVVAGFGPGDVERLLQDAGIVRHRDKIEGTVQNARALLRQWERHGSSWLTGTLAAHAPSEESLARQGFRRPPQAAADLPARCAETVVLARELKAAGFRRLGPTTLYAGLQATGFVRDHLRGCFRFGG